MSVFSVTAIDRLIEPAVPSSSSRSSSMDRGSLSSAERKPPYSFYPPLYVTPPQQRPPSPSSFSPSPYVLNYKRRGPVQNGVVDARGAAGVDANGVQQQNGFLISQSSSKVGEKQQGEGKAGIAMADLKLEKFTENHKNCLVDDVCDKIVPGDELAPAGMKSTEDITEEVQQVESEVFEIEIAGGDGSEKKQAPGNSVEGDSGEVGITGLEKLCRQEATGGYPKDQSLSAGCEGSHLASSIASLSGEEFFDAPDAPFDDSASEDEALQIGLPNSNARRAQNKSTERMTPRLQEEVLRRIRAEEALASLQLQWNEMARRFSATGLSVPSRSFQDDEFDGGQGEVDPFEQFTQKLLVARLVGGAVASGVVRAEKEEELESVVVIKNREIARLRDKLQYYELVNHEMSQRNQEAIEIAQRRRRRRRKRQRWALGCFGAAFCIGTTAVLGYKFIPWEQARTWTMSSTGQPHIEHGSSELGSQ